MVPAESAPRGRHLAWAVAPSEQDTQQEEAGLALLWRPRGLGGGPQGLGGVGPALVALGVWGSLSAGSEDRDLEPGETRSPVL